MRPRTAKRTAVAAAMLGALSGCGSGPTGSTSSGGAELARPKEATVLLPASFAGAWPSGLDPATNTTGGANLSLMNAIFGGLFQLAAGPDGRRPHVVGVLAAGYEVEDGGRRFVIHLRKGLFFSDGTPLDAEALRFNIERDLTAPCTCAPTGWPWAGNRAVTVMDDHTVALRFTRPYGAVIDAFPTSNVNWPVSPTALARAGEDAFRLAPVGAGPFVVVEDALSSRLVLERNTRYWHKGRPYLDRLVFRSIGTEQAAYEALLAGDAQAYEGLVSTQLVERAERDPRVEVTRQPPTSPYVVQLNTAAPPFDDERAREAIYYATDAEAIANGLFGGRYPISQMFTGPGGLFHHARIPGYRGYDPARARRLVHALGGLHIGLGTLRSEVAERVVTALQSQWRKAGIDASIELYEIAGLVQAFRSGQWQAMLQTAGSYDPESLTGVSSRFRSDRPFTGVKDPALDALLGAAAAAFDPERRDALYFRAGQYISDHAYAPFLFAYSPAQLTAGGLEGPGLTTKIPPLMVDTGVWWQDVRFAAP